jgi:hypothetical protein
MSDIVRETPTTNYHNPILSFDNNNDSNRAWDRPIEYTRYPISIKPDWFKDKSPLLFSTPSTQTDLLADVESLVKELINSIKNLESISYRDKLVNRLDVLYENVKDEDINDCMSLGSLRNFLKFLQINNNLRYPMISLSPDNNICASWRGEQNQVFSIHFLPSGNTNAVIAKPDYINPEKKNWFSETSKTDVLMKVVSRYRVTDWITE